MKWRKTNTKKIEAITNMKPPTYQKEVQKFIGVVNYYQDLCLRKTHMLAPVMSLHSSRIL